MNPLRYIALLVLLVAAVGCATRPDSIPSSDISATQRIAELEREVALLKKERTKQREEILAGLSAEIAAIEKQRARLVYVEGVLPILKPMMKDFGLPDSSLPPPERIETFADAYRPMFDLLRQLGEVAGGK